MWNCPKNRQLGAEFDEWQVQIRQLQHRHFTQANLTTVEVLDAMANAIKNEDRVANELLTHPLVCQRPCSA